MMLDPTLRLIITYGLIGLLLLAALALLWWRAHNAHPRRDARDRARLVERYRQRDEAAGSAPADT